MKKTLSLILLCTALPFLSFLKPAGLPIGSPLPKGDVKMKDVSGREISLREAQDKNGLLVIFSSNTCPFVVKNEKRISEIGAFAKQSGVGVILVNSNEANRREEESYDAMKKYATEQKYNWYYVMDSGSEVADAFDAKRTPECFLFDNKLNLAYHGAIDDNPADASAVTRKHLKEAISEMTSGKEISVKESRSVGCSIKRKS